MTATQTRQTQQELNEVLVKFEQEARRTGLAETEYNQKLLSDFLKKKYGGFVNGATLADAVASLKPQLQWLATPEPVKPTVKPTGNRLWNKLIDAGVAPSRHSSVAEQEAEGKRADSVKRQFVDFAQLTVERHTLIAERRSTESITIQHPRLGVIDHRRTNEARQAAIAKVNAKIEAFNAKVSDDLKISI